MRIRRPFLLVVLVSVVSSSRADDNSTATSVTFPLPPHCPTSCGNITFEYPFGVGHGCFRPGFELTCDSTTNPHKLLLGNISSIIEVVQDIDVDGSNSSNFFVNSSVVVTMDVNDNFSDASWIAPANDPYFISFAVGNQFVVVGCSVMGYLVDPTNNSTVASCSTTCPSGGAHLRNDSIVDSESCNGMGGCCTVEIDAIMQSYGIRLSRTNDTVFSASTVKAFIAWFDHDTGVSDGKVLVDWRITDQQSCDDARSETKSYACHGGSWCNEEPLVSTYPGYTCSCPGNHKGNPYVPYGCDDPSTTVNPSNNCTRKCGNVSIPFPFGLEEGCYRDEKFALICNKSSNPWALGFNISSNVAGRIVDIILDLLA